MTTQYVLKYSELKEIFSLLGDVQDAAHEIEKNNNIPYMTKIICDSAQKIKKIVDYES